MACAVEHSTSKTLFVALSEIPTPKPRLYVEWVAPDHVVPINCRHCEDAPCMHACIAGAISQTNDGVVVTEKDKCIGCWTCVMVCPYGVIGRHMDEHKAYRCDRCPDREIPACVSACPTNTLVFQSVDQYSGTQRRYVSKELISGQKG
jgi:carbon-monoxide dehydrogenase iron sulfur subunit